MQTCVNGWQRTNPEQQARQCTVPMPCFSSPTIPWSRLADRPCFRNWREALGFVTSSAASPSGWPVFLGRAQLHSHSMRRLLSLSDLAPFVACLHRLCRSVPAMHTCLSGSNNILQKERLHLPLTTAARWSSSVISSPSSRHTARKWNAI